MVESFTFLRPSALMSPMTHGRGTIPGVKVAGAVETGAVKVPVDRPGKAAPAAGPVETTGVPGAEAVDTEGSPEMEGDETAGAAELAVPDESVWDEAEVQSDAAARAHMRSLFTGIVSISNRSFPG
jgi:hypothetical protein